MRNIWQDSGLSIILLPSGEQGDRIYSIAKLWTELRMLSPAVWIRPEMLKESNDGPPQQRAVVLGANAVGTATEIEVDLFEQLARQSLSLVRLLAVRSALPDLEFDKKQDDLADLISQYLDLSLPTSISAGQSHEQVLQLIKLNLMTAPTEFHSQHGRSLVNPKFNANFIAAPEDRATPTSGDAFIRYSSTSPKFAGFTLMHVATLGGIWAGLPQGTYELVKPGVWLGDKAFISRVFMSAILTDGLARRASARVLERAADAESGFVDLNVGIPIEGTYPIPDTPEQADAWVDWMVGQTFVFDGAILKYKPAQAPEDAKALEITVKHQLADFPKFALDKLIRVPYYLFLWLYRALVKTLNAIFQGGNKGSSVIPEPAERMDVRDEVLIKEIESVAEVKLQADAALISPVTPSHSRSTPELWTKIRKLVFGMLDGANLEQFGVQRSENGLPVFYRVSALFNDPAEKLSIQKPDNLDETLEVDWSSIGEAPEIVSNFLKSSRTLTEKNASLLRELLEIDGNEKKSKEHLDALVARLSELETEQSEKDGEDLSA